MPLVTNSTFHVKKGKQEVVIPPGTVVTPADIVIDEADVDRYIENGSLKLVDSTEPVTREELEEGGD